MALTLTVRDDNNKVLLDYNIDEHSIEEDEGAYLIRKEELANGIVTLTFRPTDATRKGHRECCSCVGGV